jgi:Fe-S-cluster containining protein
MWKRAERYDILEWVYVFYNKKVPVGYDIWVHPAEGESARRCPWLRKLPKKDAYRCRIEDLKPGLCRDYPPTIKHAILTGCHGFNHLPQEQLKALIEAEEADSMNDKDDAEKQCPYNFEARGELKNLVFLGGRLIPLAHINGVSDVEYGIISFVDLSDGTRTKGYSFKTSITGYVSVDSEFDDGISIEFETEEEAGLARNELVRRIEDYYERPVGRSGTQLKETE